MIIPMKGFTHSGKFHADDVFGAALLRYLNPRIQIIRGSEVPKDFTGIVFDIGGGKYDHHQKDAPVRENGVPYAAFGLLWRETGADILGEEAAAKFDAQFIQPLDLSDNTGCPNAIADIVELYYPFWNESGNVDEAFFEAVGWAEMILRRHFLRAESLKKAAELLKPDLEKQKDGIAILTHHAPWRHLAAHTDLEFVIYHSKRGGYCAQAVEADETEAGESHTLKYPFPEQWRGREAQELAEITGIPGLRFCHNSGFLIAADTIDDAILACRKAKEIGQKSIDMKK